MAEFNITLDNKPELQKLFAANPKVFQEIVGTFVGLMEQTAENKWHELPKHIHTSLSFKDLVEGILSASLGTKELSQEYFDTLGYDLHPLALLSDQRKDVLGDGLTNYDWKKHFIVDDRHVTKETIEHIMRKILFLVRWFSVDEVSKQLLASQFPVIDSKDIQKLPFQPALKYQQQKLGDLHIAKFLHDVGAFDCGEIEQEEKICPACSIGTLVDISKIKVCPRCNAGYHIRQKISF